MFEIRAPRRARQRRQARTATLLVMSTAVMGIGAISVLNPAPRLMWNGSASAPVGLYLIDASATIGLGELVLVHPPQATRTLAVERGYLPAGAPLVKRIEAVGGDLVCVDQRGVTIKGRTVAAVLAADSHGRPLPTWSGCRALSFDEFFVLMKDVEASFDSRYFGPVTRADIVGQAVPLWTW